MFNYTMLDNFEVTQIQHGYSNKSFHSGCLKIENKEFNYIYDCGLCKTEFLNYLKKKKAKLDILFISHFHKDHINDILEFENHPDLKDTVVVMPYHDEKDKLLFGAIGGLNTNNKEDEYIDKYINFLRNPYHIWIKNNYSYNPYNKFNVNYAHNCDIGVNYKNSDFRLNDNPRHKDYPLFTFQYNGTGLNWWLLAYSAHTENLDLLWEKIYEDNPALKNLNTNYLESQNFESAKKYILEIRKSLQKLRANDIVGDASFANLMSLSLYSGPIITSEITYDSNIVNEIFKFLKLPYLININVFQFYKYLYFRNENVGWLHTGDFNLKDPNLYKDFISYYKEVMNMVGMFSLPHHGSENNFNNELLKLRNEHFIIIKSSRVKLDKIIEEEIKTHSKRFLIAQNGNNINLKVISNNLSFIGRIEQSK